jgi:hypothetical protein
MKRQIDSGFKKEPGNTTGISHWGRGYGESAPVKNQKNPTINDIDWRQLDAEECYRLWNCGTIGGKNQALAAIIKQRKEVLHPMAFAEWRRNLCGKY